MKMKKLLKRAMFTGAGVASTLLLAGATTAFGACPPGEAPAFPGSDTCILDPLSIPKYLTPLVIPPVMNDTGTPGKYEIAVRQFDQQILPAGFPATTVWSYGPAADPTPTVAPDPASQFNYPAYTIETNSMSPVDIKWINDLIDPATGNYRSHLLPVDQTLHWANPPAVGCRDGSSRTDCMTNNPAPYEGPVPLVTHVHGAHVDPHSDGYPEAWWLPAAANLTPCTAPGVPAGCFVTEGTLFDDALGQTPAGSGYADYSYRNDQPATTLWYHDHALGMTRLNVYAGPAGFWLVRGDYTASDGTVVPDAVDNGSTPAPLDGILPWPAPVAGQEVLPLNTPGDPVRNSIREIPIVIQDRSFNINGSLFYPGDRAFFEGVNPAGGTAPTLEIPFVGNPTTPSDIAPIWNPEAFFSTMVVNGVTWPTMEVAPALYRLRLLNGCNSRFLNLALFEVKTKGMHKANKDLGMEIPFYQIGAEQGFTPQVVRIRTGEATPLPGGGTMPKLVKAASKDQALLMALAERADVIVDFRGLPHGTVVRMINTAPDAPFGGFPDVPADPATTGQVMQFVINAAPADLGGPLGAGPTDPVLADGVTPNPNAATDPYSLIPAAEAPLGIAIAARRQVSLNEGESEEVCVTMAADGSIVEIPGIFDPANPGAFLNDCLLAGGVPMAPKEALLGTVDLTNPAMPAGIPLKWTDMTKAGTDMTVNLLNGGSAVVNVTENPSLGTTEEWEIYNFTMDAHPIHLHLVRFEVVGRTLFDGVTPSPNGSVQPWEAGFKDTVIAYPGEITTVRAHFDIEGLYVWHCHIVEHEDNEMMRPYIVN